MWKYASGVVIIGSVVYCLKRYFAGRSCSCKTQLDGLVIIITGANSGIGESLAFELAKKGAYLILACRNIDKANNLKKALLQKYQIKVYVKELDLNSFQSILKFTDEIDRQFECIFALVNNAGVFYHPQKLTKDNFDVTLQTNYLGPFVLTHHLVKVLKRSEEARIINIVSEAHRFVNAYDLKVITTCQTEFRTHFKAYGVSKLALLLLTKQLSKKLADCNIIVSAANPGNVETNIFRHFFPLSNPFLFALQWLIRVIVIKRPSEGTQTPLHAILTTNAKTGDYYTNCTTDTPSSLALDQKLIQDYYNLTLEIISEKFSTESEC